MTPFELSVRFFLQLVVILAACRIVGALARKVGQPQVVGEMIAGVCLGPSLFGYFLPAAQAWVFPRESMPILLAVSQVGLAIYMFLVGLEFRRDLFQGSLRSAAAVSIAGMAAPFVLGGLVALWLVGEPGFFGEGIHDFEAALFLGAAMCITAFPMLARIIHERGLAGTRLGTLSLAAGSIDDASAWCLLAVVLASLGHDWSAAVIAIGGGAFYAALTLTLGRRLLARFARRIEATRRLSEEQFAWILLLLMACSWFTDAIGIYAVFGAFILGAAMPRGFLATELHRKLEPLTVVFLLPLFFTFSGLNTRFDTVDSLFLFGVSAIVLAAACLGKGVACWAAARLSGEDNRTALAMGTLMNARGLMELIILNIGLQAGIITPTLFSIMVAMAVATTLLAAPAFERFHGRAPPGGESAPVDPASVEPASTETAPVEPAERAVAS